MLKNKETFLLIVSILVLMMPFSGHAQVDQASLIEGLSKGMNNNPNNRLLEDDEIQESEQINQVKKNKRELIFEDRNYGFSGGTSFANPPAEKYFDEPLKYFGYDFFQKSPSTYTQLKNIPVSSDYLIGPGDNFKVIIYGTRNRQFTVEVTRDGSIFIPEVGTIPVSGQTFQQARANLKRIVSKQIVGAEVDVSMGELKLISIFILGEAYQSGMYTVSSLTSIINAIFMSGGVDPSGSLRNIELKRNGVTISKLDLYDFLLRGDSTANERLMEGDVIFIPPVSKTVAINGQVRRPGIYELNEAETISELIEFAGNLKPKADLSSVEVSSVNSKNNGFSLLNIDLDLEINKSKILNNGDVISIYPVFNNLNNAILIRGHAQKPGFYPWKEGMKVGGLFQSSNDLLEMTDLNYVLIKRKNATSQRYDFLQVDLEKAFNNLDSEENITLFDQDEIILLPSLLSTDLITTKVIQDKYLLDQETDQITLQDEWTSLTYLSKSLQYKDVNSPEEINSVINGAPVISNENATISDQARFYEYSIYNYCFIPVDFAKKIIKTKGFAKTESIPIKDLIKVTTPLQLETLIQTLELEDEIEESSDELNSEITNLCRRQLIDPLITIIKNQSNPSSRQKTIKTFGDLIYPGEYPHTANMDAEDTVAASGGFKSSSNVSVIEVNTRKIQNKEYVTTSRNFSVSSINSTRFSIQPMDEVNVKKLSNSFRTAEVTGKVKFPGMYPILKGENLSDLLRRAGGVEDDASYQGAIFTREVLRESDQKRLKEAQSDLRRKILLASSQNQLTSQGQTGGNNGFSELVKLLTFNQEDNDLMGRLVIDLELMMQGRSSDILLQDGDSIHIPTKQEIIAVVGEVNGSNAHQYNSQLAVSDYISLSGGLTSFGDPSNIYIVKNDGSTVSYSNNSTGGFFRASSGLQAGDTIIVPFQADNFGQLRATREITQIIYQMAIAAAAVNSFGGS